MTFTGPRKSASMLLLGPKLLNSVLRTVWTGAFWKFSEIFLSALVAAAGSWAQATRCVTVERQADIRTTATAAESRTTGAFPRTDFFIFSLLDARGAQKPGRHT